MALDHLWGNSQEDDDPGLSFMVGHSDATGPAPGTPDTPTNASEARFSASTSAGLVEDHLVDRLPDNGDDPRDGEERQPEWEEGSFGWHSPPREPEYEYRQAGDEEGENVHGRYCT